MMPRPHGEFYLLMTMTRASHHHTMATNDDHRQGLKRRGLFFLFLFICSTKGNRDENDEATVNTSTRNDRWGAQFFFAQVN